MKLMQVPSGIDDSAATIAFATWYRRFGPVINHLRSAVFGVSLVLTPSSGLVRRPAWDADFRVHENIIRFWCLQRGPADINAADQSAVHVLCQDVVQMCLSLATVDGLEGVGHATFEVAKKYSEERVCCLLRNPAVVCRFR